MAAITLETLLKTIRFRGDYQSTRKFPDANLITEVQQSFGSYWQLIDTVHEGWWDTETTLTCTSNQRFVALPDDVWRIQGLDLEDGGGWRELRQISIADRNKYSDDADEPDAYRTSSRGIELYPVPNTSYRLRLMYTPKAPQLAVSQPREWYNGWEDYVVTKTLLALDTREGKSITERVAILDAMEKEVRRGAEQRRSQEPEYLNLRENSYGGRWRDEH